MSADFQSAPRSQRWPSPSLERPEVLYDIDYAFHMLYDEARAATQMGDRAMRRQRHYLIPQVIGQISRIPGEAAEVGCFRGLSAYVANASFEAAGRSIPFHVFDSFEGLSEHTGFDSSIHRPASIQFTGEVFACPEEQVRANLSRFSSIAYYKGWIPERFEEVADRSFCYVHIDVDLFEPTLQSLSFFWPRVSPGGAVVLDDYATVFYPGARIAICDFFHEHCDAFVLGTPSGSAVAVKKF